MDLKTIYQAQLFAPAFAFQTVLEFWGAVVEPRSKPLSAARPIEPEVLLPSITEVPGLDVRTVERELEAA